MAIQLVTNAGSTSVDIDDCDAATNISAVGTGITPVTSSGNQDIAQREGTDCVEWACGANAWNGVKVTFSTPSSVNIENDEIGLWFFKASGDNDTARFVGNYEYPGTGLHTIRLRLYSGANEVDYEVGSDDTLQGGWNHLRISGFVTPDFVIAGSWAAAQAQAVDAIAIMVYQQNANNGTGNSETQHHAIDWVKFYRNIELTSTNAYDLDDIFNENDTNNWGVITKEDIYYNFQVGLICGDGTNAGSLTDDNKFIQFDQYSTLDDSGVSNCDFNLEVEAGGYTLELGENPAGTAYAIKGTPIRARIGRPSFTVKSGGIFKYYGGKIEGFGTIDLGSGGSGVIDIVKTDFYDNTTVDIDSSNLDMVDTRFHFPDGSEANIGEINSVNKIDKMQVFNVANGFTIKTNCTITEMTVSDVTGVDFTIQNNQTVNLIDSSFDEENIGYTA